MGLKQTAVFRRQHIATIASVCIKHALSGLLLLATHCALPSLADAQTSPIRVFLDDNLISAAKFDQDTEPASTPNIDVQVTTRELQTEPFGLGVEQKASVVFEADPSAELVLGQKVKLQFRANWNYRTIAPKGEVRVYKRGQDYRNTPLAILPVDESGLATWPEAQLADGPFSYALRVYAENGTFDQTRPESLTRDALFGLAAEEIDPSEEYIGFDQRYSVQNVEVSGEAVVLQVLNVPDGHWVHLNGFELKPGFDGYSEEIILPPGDHAIRIETFGPEGPGMLMERTAHVAANDVFYAAIGDLTASASFLTPAAGEERINVEGRGALYLKGRVQGKYLITLAMDTDENNIANVFDNLVTSDPDAILTQIDPEKSYQVYGDTSSSEVLAPTRDKLYVKIERNGNFVLWGDYFVEYKDNDFVRIEAPYYGAQTKLVHRVQRDQADIKLTAESFISPPGELQEREELPGSGGLIYRLNRSNIQSGSLAASIITRNQVTGIIDQERFLTEGIDYSIDYDIGRIVLTAPLPTFSNNDNLFALDDRVFEGDPNFLAVTYRYLPIDVDLSSVYGGGRAEVDIGEVVAIGATGVIDGTGSKRQSLAGVEAKVAIKRLSFLKAEFARSESTGFGDILTNGGVQSPDQTLVSSNAWRAKAYVRLDEFDLTKSAASVLGYYQRKDRGFAGPLENATTDEESFGGELVLPFANDRASFNARAQSRRDLIAETRSRELSADINGRITTNVRGGVGVKHLEDSFTGRRTDIGARVTVRVQPKLEIGLFGRTTLSASDPSLRGSRGGIRSSYKVTDRVTFGSEVSIGKGGFGTKLGFLRRDDLGQTSFLSYETALDPGSTFYLNNPNQRSGLVVAGNNMRLSERFSINGESRLQHRGSNVNSYTQVAGLSYALNDRLTLGGNFDLETQSDANDKLFISRMSSTAQVSGGGVGWNANGSLSYTRAKDFFGATTNSWEFTGNVDLTVSPDWRLLTNLNTLRALSDVGTNNSNVTRLKIGGAYRPIANNRLRVLSDYTAYFDVETKNAGGFGADYRQKSHIFSVDADYDISPKLTIGGRYGLKLGSQTSDRPTDDWRTVTVQLAKARLDYQVTENWGTLLEGRLLHINENKQLNVGALASIYRRLNDNVKLGLGVTIASVSDDLTNLNARTGRVFFNVATQF